MNLMKVINYLYYPKETAKLPTLVMVEPADGCTLKCVMCDVQQKKTGSPHFLSAVQFKFILEQFPRIRELIFCGIGEPLLNKDIFSMISAARVRGIPFINLITNGELLDSEISERILDSGINQLHISVPAVTEESFQRIRNHPRVSLASLSDNIRYLTGRKSSKSAGVKVIINLVMMKYNYAELKGVVSFCKELGADGICLVQLTTILGEKENINVDRNGISRLFSELKALGNKEGLDIVFLTGNDYGRCYQLWDFILVHADGSISPCNGIMPGEGMSLGNIFKTDIKTIWLSDAYRALRRQVRRTSLENCRFCESGYPIEGTNLRWFKNYYLRPVRNFIAQKVKHAL